MNRTAASVLGLAALLAAAPASAVTLDNGVVLITQADALAGGVTPGDTPGFPVTLSVSGSYRFASNLQVSTSVNGIEVTAPEVTIDMAGFRMAGGGVGFTAISSNQRALTIRNGTIRGFQLSAILAQNHYLVVERMRIVDNATFGFSTAIAAQVADYVTVSNSNISRNGEGGVDCRSFCRVENSIIAAGADFGVAIRGGGGVVLGNTIAGHVRAINADGQSVAFGDNTFVGNAQASAGTLLPLDPNQPPPPP